MNETIQVKSPKTGKVYNVAWKESRPIEEADYEFFYRRIAELEDGGAVSSPSVPPKQQGWAPYQNYAGPSPSGAGKPRTVPAKAPQPNSPRAIPERGVQNASKVVGGMIGGPAGVALNVASGLTKPTFYGPPDITKSSPKQKQMLRDLQQRPPQEILAEKQKLIDMMNRANAGIETLRAANGALKVIGATAAIGANEAKIQKLYKSVKDGVKRKAAIEAEYAKSLNAFARMEQSGGSIQGELRSDALRKEASSLQQTLIALNTAKQKGQTEFNGRPIDEILRSGATRLARINSVLQEGVRSDRIRVEKAAEIQRQVVQNEQRLERGDYNKKELALIDEKAELILRISSIGLPLNSVGSDVRAKAAARLEQVNLELADVYGASKLGLSAQDYYDNLYDNPFSIHWLEEIARDKRGNISRGASEAITAATLLRTIPVDFVMETTRILTDPIDFVKDNAIGTVRLLGKAIMLGTPLGFLLGETVSKEQRESWENGLADLLHADRNMMRGMASKWGESPIASDVAELVMAGLVVKGGLHFKATGGVKGVIERAGIAYQRASRNLRRSLLDMGVDKEKVDAYMVEANKEIARMASIQGKSKEALQKAVEMSIREAPKGSTLAELFKPGYPDAPQVPGAPEIPKDSQIAYENARRKTQFTPKADETAGVMPEGTPMPVTSYKVSQQAKAAMAEVGSGEVRSRTVLSGEAPEPIPQIPDVASMSVARRWFDDGKVSVGDRIDVNGKPFVVAKDGAIVHYEPKVEVGQAAVKKGGRIIRIEPGSDGSILYVPRELAPNVEVPKSKSQGKAYPREPVERTQRIRDGYLREYGGKVGALSTVGGAPRLLVDEQLSQRIADAFDEMKHDPQNPEVKRAYEAFKQETKAQFEYILKHDKDLRIEPWGGKGEPYPDGSAQMMDDVRNGNFKFYKTLNPEEASFGSSLEKIADNPLLEYTDYTFKDSNGVDYRMTYNDLFRVVHDYMAHTTTGNQFGAIGEMNAWFEHYRMYGPEARRAMSTETLGQNSWVNFGKHLRDERGVVPLKGEPGYKGLPERPFSDQKVGLLPDELVAAVQDVLESKVKFPDKIPDNGFTWDVKTGTMNEDYGYVFGQEAKNRKVGYSMRIDRKPTKSFLTAFYQRVRNVLEADPDARIGGWYDENAREWVVEVSYHKADLSDAVEGAQGEIAIWDANKGDVIKTPFLRGGVLGNLESALNTLGFSEKQISVLKVVVQRMAELAAEQGRAIPKVLITNTIDALKRNQLFQKVETASWNRLRDLLRSDMTKIGFVEADNALVGEATLPSGAKVTLEGGAEYRLAGVDPVKDGTAFAVGDKAAGARLINARYKGVELFFTRAMSQEAILSANAHRIIEAEIQHALDSKSISKRELLSHINDSIDRLNAKYPNSPLRKAKSVEAFLKDLQSAFDSKKLTFEMNRALAEQFWRGSGKKNPFKANWRDIADSVAGQVFKDKKPGDLMTALGFEKKPLIIPHNHRSYKVGIPGENYGALTNGATFWKAVENSSFERVFRDIVEPAWRKRGATTDSVIENRIAHVLRRGHKLLLPDGYIEVPTDNLLKFIDTDGRVGFYQLKKGKPVGAYSISGRAIQLLKGQADFSTVVHEFGHFFHSLLLGDERYKAIIKREYGDLTLENIESAERFANHFEAYLRTGKAPIKSLTDVFAAIKEWIKAVRSKIKYGKISKEVQAVFDDVYSEVTPRQSKLIQEFNKRFGTDRLKAEVAIERVTEFAQRAGAIRNKAQREAFLDLWRKRAEVWAKEQGRPVEEFYKDLNVVLDKDAPERALFDEYEDDEWYGEDDPAHRYDRDLQAGFYFKSINTIKSKAPESLTVGQLISLLQNNGVKPLEINMVLGRKVLSLTLDKKITKAEILKGIEASGLWDKWSFAENDIETRPDSGVMPLFRNDTKFGDLIDDARGYSTDEGYYAITIYNDINYYNRASSAQREFIQGRLDALNQLVDSGRLTVDGKIVIEFDPNIPPGQRYGDNKTYKAELIGTLDGEPYRIDIQYLEHSTLEKLFGRDYVNTVQNGQAVIMPPEIAIAELGAMVRDYAPSFTKPGSHFEGEDIPDFQPSDYMAHARHTRVYKSFPDKPELDGIGHYLHVHEIQSDYFQALNNDRIFYIGDYDHEGSVAKAIRRLSDNQAVFKALDEVYAKTFIEYKGTTPQGDYKFELEVKVVFPDGTILPEDSYLQRELRREYIKFSRAQFIVSKADAKRYKIKPKSISGNSETITRSNLYKAIPGYLSLVRSMNADMWLKELVSNVHRFKANEGMTHPLGWDRPWPPESPEPPPDAIPSPWMKNWDDKVVERLIFKGALSGADAVVFDLGEANMMASYGGQFYPKIIDGKPTFVSINSGPLNFYNKKIKTLVKNHAKKHGLEIIDYSYKLEEVDGSLKLYAGDEFIGELGEEYIDLIDNPSGWNLSKITRMMREDVAKNPLHGSIVVRTTPEFRAKALDTELPLFDKTPEGVRAWYDAQTRTIGLFSKKTTFESLIHESFHDWSRPEALLDNHVNALESVYGDRGSVDYYEGAVQGFLEYLRTGDAPTPELAKTFATIREALLATYKSTRTESVRPEIRAMFDKMISGDQAIRRIAKEVVDEQPQTIAGDHRSVEQDLARIAQQQLSKEEQGTFQGWLDEAKSKGLTGRVAQQMAEDLVKNPRTLSPVEHAGLVHRKAELVIEIENVEKAIDKRIAEGDLDGAATLKEEYDSLIDDYTAVEKALYATGSKAGASLVAQKLAINRQLDTATVIARAQREKGAPLSKAERAELEMMAKKLKEAEQALAEHQAKKAERVIRAKVSRVTKSQEQLDADLNQILEDAKRIGLGVNDVGRIVGEGLVLVGKLTYHAIERGLSKLEDIVIFVRQHYPAATREQIIDVLAPETKKPEPRTANQENLARAQNEARQNKRLKQDITKKQQQIQETLESGVPPESEAKASPDYDRETQRLIRERNRQREILQKAIRSVRPMGMFEKARHAVRAIRLGYNISGRARDLLSNAMSSSVEKLATSNVAALSDKLFWRNASKTQGSANSFFSGKRYLESLKGARARWQAELADQFLHGIDDINLKYNIRREISLKHKGLQEFVRRAARTAGLTDVTFKDMAYQLARRELAEMQAKHEGLTGRAAQARVDELITYDPDNINLPDGESALRAQIEAIAQEESLTAVFGNQNLLSEGMSALESRLIQKYGDKAHAVMLVGDIIVQFPKIFWNLAGRAVDYSPAGVAKALTSWASGKRAGGFTLAQRRRINTLVARGFVGTAAYYLGRYAYENKILEPEAIDEQAGYVSHGVLDEASTGAGRVFLLGNKIAAIEQSGALDKTPTGRKREADVAAKMKNRLAFKERLGLVLEQPAFSGPESLMQAFDSPQAAAKYAGRLTSSVLIPGAIRGPRRDYDYFVRGVKYRKSKGFWDEIFKNLPFLDKRLEPVMRPGQASDNRSK